MRSKRALQTSVLVLCVAVTSAIMGADTRRAPRFLPDDPRPVDEDTRFDASHAVPRGLGRYADFVVNTFRTPGDSRDLPAQNVNTMGEVPDSSWFTNRIGTARMSIETIVRGPDRHARLDAEHWVIVEGKDTGRQPGFRAVNAADPQRTLYQLEFDPRGNPEMATGAEIIGTAIYHAIGYNVVESYLVELDPAKVSIAPGATISVAGRTRPFTRRDLNQILRGAAKKANGRYRVSASPFAKGRYLGPFRYYGTRPDDPNDIVPHEHRRELRGARVFAAWVNHDDSRAGNSLDMLTERDGQKFVKHYMFDFGSILGSGTNEQDHPWVGSEYLVEGKPGFLTLASLGMWRRPFIGNRVASGLPAAGNFTADGFDPANWRPHYPNQAFRHLQPEDAFWAARIVAQFTPEAIAAIVAKAQFSDPRATDVVAGTLQRRRDLTLRTWLTAINPVAAPAVAGEVLRFDNAAELSGVVQDSSEYEVAWFTYDNESGVRTPVGTRLVHSAPALTIPQDALGEADYAGVEVRTLNANYPSWARPVRVYLRRGADGWMPVGVERSEARDGRVRYARK
jgi:hypothetical protein